MPELRDVVTSFLDAKDWSHADLADGSLMLTFAGENGRFRCRVVVDPERASVSCFALFPGRVPGGRGPAVLELINQANLNLVVGNFEYDPEPGQVRCRTSINVEGDRLTHALLTHVVHASLLAMDRYLPDLEAVITEA